MLYLYYVVSLAQLSWICHVMLRYMYVRCSCRSHITELFLFSEFPRLKIGETFIQFVDSLKHLAHYAAMILVTISPLIHLWLTALYKCIYLLTYLLTTGNPRLVFRTDIVLRSFPKNVLWMLKPYCSDLTVWGCRFMALPCGMCLR